MIRTFLGAVSFLTVIPVRGETAPPGRSAIFFPLVGAMLGAAGAAIYLALARVVPSAIAALIVVAFWAAISGVLHEDGLADSADAFRAGRSREKMVAILKDSRIGSYGAVAIVLSIVVRWQAVEHLSFVNIFAAFIAAQATPRAAIVMLAWVSRPAGNGLGQAFASTMTTPAALIAGAQGVAAALACGIRPGLAILLGTYLILRVGHWYFYRRIGGVNGDCLGATEQFVEIFILVLFTCRACSW